MHEDTPKLNLVAIEEEFIQGQQRIRSKHMTKPKYFRHYKGKHYRLITDEAEMEMTGGKVVVYESIGTGNIYVRPYNDFYGKVVNNSEEFNRFEPLT